MTGQITNFKNLLTREKALIFRIIHRDNLPWMLNNGLHCRASGIVDTNYVSIGNPDLIEKRATRIVSAAPGGTLDDYIPFYFTPRSPMLLNILTGYRGIAKREKHEIIFLISSLPNLMQNSIPFMFSDRHAGMNTAQFSSDLRTLDRIPWVGLQTLDFKRDDNDLEKFERYQAEALVHRHLPVSGLIGAACHDNDSATYMEKCVANSGGDLKIVLRPDWYG